MSLPSISPDMLSAGGNHFLSRTVPSLGISLSEMDYLRAWRDDFLGNTLDANRYATAINGVGSVAFVTTPGTVPAGWIQGSAGAGAGRYSRLWLGDAVDGLPSLDADAGWAMIVRWQTNNLTNAVIAFGAYDLGAGRYCLAQYDSAVGANWLITSRDGAASTTAAAFGPAINTTYWMAMEVEADHARLCVNGVEAVDKITNIPHEILTPMIYVFSRGNATTLSVDLWDVIPR